MNKSVLRLFVLLSVSLYVGGAAAGEVRTLTLREAVRIALAQNPDVLLARISELKAERAAAVSRSAFSPSVYAGSGLGLTRGIPQSVEGATPSIVQVTARKPLFDLSLRNRIREADQLTAAAAHSAAARRDEAVYRVAETYLDFERAVRRVDLLSEQSKNFERAERSVAARVEEGREIPLSLTRSRLDRARAERRLALAESDRRVLEATLRGQLGLADGLRLAPGPDEGLPDLPLPESASAGAARAVRNSPELMSLAAELRAKRFAVAASRGERAPKLDLVAQYSLLSRFNNFEQFFNDFERHNFQVGIALQVPLYTGKSVAAGIAKARIEAREIELRGAARRSRVEVESIRLYEQVEGARGALKLARLELAYARETLSVLLAKYEEGRIALDEIERQRARETEAWERYYDAQYDLRKAQLNLLRRTGDLAAALG